MASSGTISGWPSSPLRYILTGSIATAPAIMFTHLATAGTCIAVSAVTRQPLRAAASSSAPEPPSDTLVSALSSMGKEQFSTGSGSFFLPKILNAIVKIPPYHISMHWKTKSSASSSFSISIYTAFISATTISTLPALRFLLTYIFMLVSYVQRAFSKLFSRREFLS